MTFFKKMAFATVLALAVSPALAHESNMPGITGMNMPGMMGMHDMAVTVTALDATTGMVDVNAGGMMLKIHFPPSTLSSVKVGDKITVHLGFTKP